MRRARRVEPGTEVSTDARLLERAERVAARNRDLLDEWCSCARPLPAPGEDGELYCAACGRPGRMP